MHGLATLLAEEDLVDIGLEDAPLVVAELDQQRDQRLIDLAHIAAPAIEKQVLDQLLGQRRAALNDAARAQIGPARAQNRQWRDAMMVLEISILDRLQSPQQQGRQLLKLNQPALFLLQSVQGRNAGRIQLGMVECGTCLQIDKGADPPIG